MVTVKEIEKSTYRAYLYKASDFYQNMQIAFKDKHWNSVGLAAVHCTISANDALLAYFGGIRNTSQDHKEGAKLLRRHIPDSNDITEKTNQYLKIMARKNLIEYEGRLFLEKDAIEIRKLAERFFKWAKSKLPK